MRVSSSHEIRLDPVTRTLLQTLQARACVGQPSRPVSRLSAGAFPQEALSSSAWLCRVCLCSQQVNEELLCEFPDWLVWRMSPYISCLPLTVAEALSCSPPPALCYFLLPIIKRITALAA